MKLTRTSLEEEPRNFSIVVAMASSEATQDFGEASRD
jgi:hypothetical protein